MKINIQLEKNFTTQINRLKEKYGDNQPSGMSIINGPNYSTDIENTFVNGGIGCKQIALFLVEM